MPIIRGAVTEAAGTLEALLGLSRTRRLRAQLRDTIELYEGVKKHQDLSVAGSHLAEAIEHQALQVREAVLRPRRSWDWATLLGGFVFTAAAGSLAWFGGWQQREHWWGLLILIPLALLTLMFFLATISAAKGPPKDKTHS